MDMCTSDVVSKLLEQHSDSSKYKSIDVQKDIDVQIDLGNMLVCDPNPIKETELRSNRRPLLLNLARDNIQLLVNKLWQLPSERVEDVVVVKLPAPTTRIPREKPIPAARQMTKWEKFAQTKGIQKKKKSRMVFDEQSKEYKPRWGYKRANDETQDWLIPVPDTADPNEDQFEKRLKAKKERVAKNELQRLRNLARNMKGKVPGVGLTPTANPDKDHLSRALVAAKTSNASMGSFTESLSKESEFTKGTGKKRKFLPNVSEVGKEKLRALDILSKLGGGGGIVDKEKAAKVHVASQKIDSSGADGSSESKMGRKSNKFKKGNVHDRNKGGQFKSRNSEFNSKGPHRPAKSNRSNFKQSGGQKSFRQGGKGGGGRR